MSRHLLAAALIVMAVAPWSVAESDAPASNSAFDKAWKAYQEGDRSPEAFASLAHDESKPAATRFKGAYMCAVMAIESSSGEEALKWLSLADDHRPDRPQVSLRRAQAHRLLGNLKPMGKSLKKARKGIKKKSPLYGALEMETARLEHEMGNSKKAEKRLRRLLSRDRKSWQPAFLLATIAEDQHRAADAIAAYEIVIDRDPKKDPFKGIYAYQRAAALSMSSDPGSYGNSKKLNQALSYYAVFLERAEKNRVPNSLISKTRSAVMALEYFKKQ